MSKKGDGCTKSFTHNITKTAKKAGKGEGAPTDGGDGGSCPAQFECNSNWKLNMKRQFDGLTFQSSVDNKGKWTTWQDWGQGLHPETR